MEPEQPNQTQLSESQKSEAIPTLNTPQPSIVTPPDPLQGGSKKKATVALILAIVALVIGIVWIVSIPIAIVALVLAILVLVKKKPGKGLGVAAIIIAGIALLVAPIWILLTIVSYNGITQKAKETAIQAAKEEKPILTKLESDCFTFEIPNGYSEEKNERAECYIAINAMDGVQPTRVEALALPGPAKDPTTFLEEAKTNAETKGIQVTDSGTMTTDSTTVYFLKFIETNGDKGSSYFIIDKDLTHTSPDGKPIGMYVVTTYTYNSVIDSVALTVVDSFKLK